MDQVCHFRLVITGPELKQEFDIPRGTSSIGRDPENDLVLDNPKVSRRHARIECTTTQCQIEDLGSANGTRVNGERLRPEVLISLSPDDEIQIADYTLVLEQVPDEVLWPEETPARPMAEPPEAGSRPPLSPPPSRPEAGQAPTEDDLVPPGLSIFSHRLLSYLPGCYQPPVFDEELEARQQGPATFMARFLGLFESILTPIEWNVDNFDLYLDPDTAPTAFLPWLANWFDITFDPSWNQKQRRALLREAHHIYARRGTRRALVRHLQIFTGVTPEIVEPQDTKDKAHHFQVVLRVPSGQTVYEPAVERIIQAHKPAHTTYSLNIIEVQQ